MISKGCVKGKVTLVLAVEQAENELEVLRLTILHILQNDEKIEIADIYIEEEKESHKTAFQNMENLVNRVNELADKMTSYRREIEAQLKDVIDLIR